MTRISPYALGATLYVPVTRSDIGDVAMGHKIEGLRSVVLCLEDAVAEHDVAQGIRNLRGLLAHLDAEDRQPDGRPLLFVRPRNVAMAAELAAFRGIERVNGFVAPKSGPGTMRSWYDAVAGTDLLLMPTLETKEFFDPVAVRDFRDELIGLGRERVLALRIGGNDLLACLGLRRVRGMTLYDGPLGTVVGNLVGQLGSEGFALTSPVYEIIDDLKTLAEELRRDIAFGLVGKTAIHPKQVGVIHEAFRVDQDDLDAANRILEKDAAAVFQMNGAMCEPTTHRAWAYNIVQRAHYHGIVGTAQPTPQIISDIEIPPLTTTTAAERQPPMRPARAALVN